MASAAGAYVEAQAARIEAAAAAAAELEAENARLRQSAAEDAARLERERQRAVNMVRREEHERHPNLLHQPSAMGDYRNATGSGVAGAGAGGFAPPPLGGFAMAPPAAAVRRLPSGGPASADGPPLLGEGAPVAALALVPVGLNWWEISNRRIREKAAAEGWDDQLGERNGELYCHMCQSHCTEAHLGGKAHTRKLEWLHHQQQLQQLQGTPAMAAPSVGPQVPPGYGPPEFFLWDEQKDWYFCRLCGKYADESHIMSEGHKYRITMPHVYLESGGYRPSGLVQLPGACMAPSAASYALSAAPVAAPQLPLGWAEYHAADGRAYYHHAATNTTRWMRPQWPDVQLPTAPKAPPALRTAAAPEVPGHREAVAGAVAAAPAPEAGRHGWEAGAPPPPPEVAGGAAAQAATPPPGWTCHEQDGRRYYYNIEEKKSQWEFPERPRAQPAAVVEALGRTSGWLQHFDKAEGKPYYYHAASGRTQWEDPAELLSPNGEADYEEPAEQAGPHTAPSSSTASWPQDAACPSAVRLPAHWRESEDRDSGRSFY